MADAGSSATAPQQIAITSTPGSPSGDETSRGRGGFRGAELRTIPPLVKVTKGQKAKEDTDIKIMANYVQITPMSGREFYQYRVDFSPDVENLSIRKRLFRLVTDEPFSRKVVFDGMHDARSGHNTAHDEEVYSITHPADQSLVTITLKKVGKVSNAFELIRLYNMHMKNYLKELGFYRMTASGAFVHPRFTKPVGANGKMVNVMGFKTAANVHDSNKILMNLEAVHKLMQRENVAQYITSFYKTQRPTWKEDCDAALVGKLVVTGYNKIVYRIEKVDYTLKPTSEFDNRKSGGRMSYLEYYQTRYNVRIVDPDQPLLQVIQNNQRRQDRDGEATHDIYLVPELCNIAGLTNEQRADNKLKMDLIKSSQIAPDERVRDCENFLKQLHNNQEISKNLQAWGYNYGTKLVKILGRTLEREKIGVGKELANEPAIKWPKVDDNGSFDSIVVRQHIAKPPEGKRLAIIVSRADGADMMNIINVLKQGFDKIGFVPHNVERIIMDDGARHSAYERHLRSLNTDTDAAIVVLPVQNKENYDTIKKRASCQMGLVTQVVTTRLLKDTRKSSGAAVKIGVQLAAKLGGEPWYINLPLKGSMICGYDTYHDTAQRGRSFGAFVASMNDKYSQWYSKADEHNALEELSSHMATNLTSALQRYNKLNKNLPERVFIYRDGVSDGQLDHVFRVELDKVQEALKACGSSKPKLTMIVVNKKVGARFYMKTDARFVNPPPGSVIDDVVTRKERFDFYLISQSTRNGTVAPTYYNIICDESGIAPARHQAMAYKMCFNYYNWTGSVRVPAPCQYAHKLALLCGEHLHQVPHTSLDDRLHFL